MRYASDLKNPTLAELDEIEADWRETVGRMYEYLTEHEHCPTPDEAEAEDCDPTIVIDGYVDDVERAANDWVADTIQWAEVARLRVKARAKAAKKTAKAKTGKKAA
jgi:hypothetical protein